MTTVFVKEIKNSIRCDNFESYTPMVPHIVFEFQQHENNNIGLFFSPPFIFHPAQRERIYKYLDTHIQNSETQIYFDNMWEGHVLTPVNEIHKFIYDLNLNPKNCFFFTGGLQAQHLYDDYCKQYSITPDRQINIRTTNLWEYLTRKSCEISNPSFKIENRDKTFLCFNRMNRKHRTALLGMLHSKNLVDKSYYSFFVPAYGKTKTLQDMLTFLRSHINPQLHSDITDSLLNIYPQLPLKINTNFQTENINYVKADDQYYFESSYFSLVTETFFFSGTFDGIHTDENSVFFSEKIFKPIICKHPFILVSRPHSLTYLKKMGYKTFHPYIDETYDEIENDEQRLIAIVNEVERLSKQTDNEWIEWLTNIQDIVEHNYNIIMNKDKSEFVFNEL